MSYQDELDISIVRQHVHSKYPTQRAAAKALGIHECRLSEALNGRRDMLPELLVDAGIQAPPVLPPVDGSRGRRAPGGYTRLTVNLRDYLHAVIKRRAIEENITAGQLIERWAGLEQMARKSGNYETPQFTGMNTWETDVPCIPTSNRWHSRLYRWLRGIGGRS